MRGSSATEQLLAQHPEWQVRVLVVWEPILVTDWSAPGSHTLARIADTRVRQFWDPDHFISNELKDMAGQRPSGPRPNFRKRFYWDEAVVYAPQSRWEESPPARFWKGPVYRIIPGLEEALSTQ